MVTGDHMRMAMSSKEKMRRHRAKRRAVGMKKIEIWVPDPSSPHFAAEAQRQSRLANGDPASEQTQQWVDEASAWIWKQE